MNVIVRKYNDLDYDVVNSLILSSFGYEKKNKNNENVLEFVCEFDSSIVGYFNMTEFVDIVKEIKINHIDYVCVDSKYRGMGIGKKMMEYAIEYSKSNGVERLELTSSSKRETAHKLYLSLGFEIRDSSIFRKELI